MNTLIFGASGRVGRRLCDRARSDGHSVTAFVRTAESAPAGVDVVEGDVTDAAAVEAAIGDCDAVCSAVGPDSSGDTSPVTDGIGNIVTAMETRDIDRLVAVSAAGILQATPHRLRLELPEFSTVLGPVAAAHKAVYERLQESALAWTLVCPPEMPDGEPRNHYQTAVGYLPDGGQSVSTGDVAAFVYSTLVEETHLRERVGIAY